MERDRQRWVQLYTEAVSIAGIAILPVAVMNAPEDLIGFSVFCGLAIAAELLSVELFATTRHSRISVSAIISIAVIMIYGPWSAALLGALVGVVSIYTTSKKAHRKTADGRASWLRRGMFNLGMMVISNAAAGSVYVLAGGDVGSPAQISNLLPLAAAVVCDEVINVAILLGVLTLQTRKKPSALWKQNFAWAAPLSIASGIIGGWALAMAYDMYYILGLLVFVLPVATTGYSIRLYVLHTKQYVGRLEALNKTLDEANVGLLETLGAVIDAYDVFTYGHSAQVAVYAEAIVERMGLPHDQRAAIVKAALVHDVGKVGVTDRIIGKQGPLSAEEYYQVQRHPVIGADILRRMNGLKDLVPLVRHHHEHWDGTGYPAGLAGEEIPLGARVIAVADAVDAMISARPYRAMQSITDVRLEMLRCSGTQFDPAVVRAMMAVMDARGPEFFTDSAPALYTGPAENAAGVEDRLCYLKKSSIVE